MRKRIVTTAIALLLAGTMLAPASATSLSSDIEDMEIGKGILTVTTDDEILMRSVEAWVAQDGRYRVIVASLDGSEASETVVFDGQRQGAVVTDPAGNQSTVEGATGQHFAVLWEVPKTATGQTTVLFEKAANGLMARHHIAYDSGVTSELQIDWTTTAVDNSLFRLPANTMPLTYSSADTKPSGPTTRASGASYATFPDFWGSACVDAYNFRNNSNGYFRATSTSRNSCYYVSVTLWEGAATGGSGICSAIQWLGTGPTAANYSAKLVNPTDPKDLSPTCSSHAGWLSDWMLVVAWKGLNTAV